jgi:hypothetical protein
MSTTAHFAGMAMATEQKHSSTHSWEVSSNNPDKLSETMSPGYRAEVARLDTFVLLGWVKRPLSDQALGKVLVDAWLHHAIIQIVMRTEHKAL